jgi:hypothetical protein
MENKSSIGQVSFSSMDECSYDTWNFSRVIRNAWSSKRYFLESKSSSILASPDTPF